MSTIFSGGRGENWNIDTPEGMKNAVAWTNAVFALMVDGGRWMVPRSGTIYEVNHLTHTVRRIIGLVPEPVIERVIKAAGWNYIDSEEKP